MSDNPNEVARDYEEVMAEESVIMMDTSYGDDVVFCLEADKSEVITISSNDSSLLKSSFNSSNSDVMDITPSITDYDASNMSLTIGEADNRWEDARARSGKRFEKATGLSHIRTGRFELKPVGIYKVLF